MEKRALIAFVLSMLVFIGWSYFFSPTTQPPTSPPTQAENETGPGPVAAPAGQTAATPAAPTAATLSSPAVADRPARDVTVKTKLFTAVFTEMGGRLKSLTVNKYRAAIEPSSPPKELVYVENPADLPLGLTWGKNNQIDLGRGLFQAEVEEINLAETGQTGVLAMTHQSPAGLEVTRKYHFDADSYLIKLEVTVRNLSAAPFDDNLVLSLASEAITKKETYAGFGAYLDGTLLSEIKPDKLEDELSAFRGRDYKLTWAAYEDQYFLAAILPRDQEHTRLAAEPYAKKGIRINFISAPLVLAPQAEQTVEFTVYYGPKDYKILKSLNNELGRSIYFGWFDILSKPLLILMTWLYGFVGNYGLVIILVTVMIKIIFWPLTAKSYRSMKAMQKLQPKIMKLREKYKDDREGLNRETMQLYKAYQVNPLGGCLPMIIQIPVFIALYRLLDYSLELRHAPFWLWINDLAAPDRLFHFGFSIPMMEPPAGIPVLTLLMGASMLLQQKMTPTPGDPIQAKVMMLMPIFFTFIFINFPSGLVLYWLVNNILSIGQQTLINRKTT
ncbi:MAG: membrane protein insertase YidC [Pseudomonadota bacterium]